MKSQSLRCPSKLCFHTRPGNTHGYLPQLNHGYTLLQTIRVYPWLTLRKIIMHIWDFSLSLFLQRLITQHLANYIVCFSCSKLFLDVHILQKAIFTWIKVGHRNLSQLQHNNFASVDITHFLNHYFAVCFQSVGIQQLRTFK